VREEIGELIFDFLIMDTSFGWNKKQSMPIVGWRE
jgi:hypothetical protein